METFIYSARYFMLVKSLQSYGHEFLNPIFVSACGLCQALANVYKGMKGKKNFFKLTIEDVNKKKSQSNLKDSPSKPFNKTVLLPEPFSEQANNSVGAIRGQRGRLLSNIAEDYLKREVQVRANFLIEPSQLILGNEEFELPH
jgi:hypothetical protein